MPGAPNINDLMDNALVVTSVCFGVYGDGGGFAFVNGKPTLIHPWGPLFNVATSLSVIQAASLISDPAARVQVQKAAFDVASGEMEKLGRQIAGAGG